LILGIGVVDQQAHQNVGVNRDQSPAPRRRMADAGMAAVRSQRGATALTLEALGTHCGITPG